MASDAEERSTEPVSETTEQAAPSVDLATALVGLPNKTQYNAIVTWGKLMAASGFFEDARNEAQAAVKILYGLENGFSIGAAMAGVHIIEGKPALAANLQAAKVKGSGRYDYEVLKHDDEQCTLAWLRKTESGWAKFGESTFTVADAERAGLFGRKARNWERYPRNMLFARALTNGIRFYCPDIFISGPVYTPDELLPDLALSESGEPESIEAFAVPVREQREPSRALTTTPRAGDPEVRRPAGPRVPAAAGEIESVRDFLTWANAQRHARGLGPDTRAILAALEVESAAEINTRYTGRWQEAMDLVVRALGGPLSPPPAPTLDDLTPEQRVIYDEVIASGGDAEQAMLLATGGDDDVQYETGGEHDDEDDGTDEAVSGEAAAEVAAEPATADEDSPAAGADAPVSSA